MSILRIEHLKKSFGSLETLKDVNAEIEKGDVISLIGPSGTGKTTLLRCLIGLEKVTDGKIYLYDQDITGSDKKAEALRLSMGMVFQSYNLFEHRTVIENVMMAPVKNLKISKNKLPDMPGSGGNGQSSDFTVRYGDRLIHLFRQTVQSRAQYDRDFRHEIRFFTNLPDDVL